MHPFGVFRVDHAKCVDVRTLICGYSKFDLTLPRKRWRNESDRQSIMIVVVKFKLFTLRSGEFQLIGTGAWGVFGYNNRDSLKMAGQVTLRNAE